jgi:hypothetical protein
LFLKNSTGGTTDFSLEKWQLIFYDDKYSTDNLGTFRKPKENFELVQFDSHRGQSNDFMGWTTYYMVEPSQLLVDAFNAQIRSDNCLGGKYRGKGIIYDVIYGSSNTYISKYNLEKGDPYSTYNRYQELLIYIY